MTRMCKSLQVFRPEINFVNGQVLLSNYYWC